MPWKSRVQRLEGYNYKVDVWSSKSAKSIVWNPKYAIFSYNTGKSVYDMENSHYMQFKRLDIDANEFLVCPLILYSNGGRG